MPETKRYTADINVGITVEFIDNGEDTLIDQAIDAVWSHTISPHDSDPEIVGKIKEIT